jgi:hypothetical protein
VWNLGDDEVDDLLLFSNTTYEDLKVGDVGIASKWSAMARWLVETQAVACEGKTLT